LQLNRLIEQLIEIRDRAPGNGELPVLLNGPGLNPVAFPAAFNADGNGPVTDPSEPIAGVWIEEMLF
jgi:hypothetical protein